MKKLSISVANRMLCNSNIKNTSGIINGFLVLNFTDISIEDVKNRYDIKQYDAKMYLTGEISIVFRMER